MKVNPGDAQDDPAAREQLIAQVVALLEAHPNPERVIFMSWDGVKATPATMLREIRAGSDRGKRYLEIYELGLRRISS